MNFRQFSQLCMVCFVIGGAVLFGSSPGFAAQTGKDSVIIIPKEVTFEENVYRRPDWDFISKLSWWSDRADPEQESHVDMFIRLNECNMYLRYRNDEFEWPPLRDAMKKYLVENKKTFSHRVYFDFPVALGAYNLQKEIFVVEAEQLKKGMRNFYPNLMENLKNNSCGYIDMVYGFPDSLKESWLKVYPTELLFRFVRPMSLPYLKINKDSARTIVNLWKQKNAQNRDVYMRLYVTIDSFLEYDGPKRSSYKSLPVYMSMIDGYQIFIEDTMEVPIVTKVFRKKRQDNSLSTPDGSETEEQTP
ncbi:MAG: DUF4852 domain-containing protein [Rhodospirillales bacterium]|nr:DUF4852 domain-containing protein [Rhodospirillales bacterium]